MTKEKTKTINFHKKYSKLFSILNNKLPQVDTVIITGGRGSGKSLSVAVFSVMGVVKLFWKIIYTRFTATSIGDSIKEEVDEAITELGYDDTLVTYKREIYDLKKKLKISFKGLKTGSKNQKANLKSIKGFNIWVLDEAEECPDFETFQKIYLSIRHKTKRNLSILILNPAYKQHWIFKHFFVNRGVQGGFNGVKDNVLYIHTSYLDLPDGALPENIIKEYDRMKTDNPKMYNNIVLGGWLDRPEGVLIPFEDLRLFPNTFDNGEKIKRMVFVDPSEKGGDMMSAIFTEVSIIDGRLNAHVYDAIHSNAGYEIISAMIHEKAVKTNVSEVVFEKNGVGLATGLALKNLNINNNYKLIPFHSKVNKEIRIGSNYEFVKRHYSFNIDYKKKKMFNSFIEHLTQYSIDEKEAHTADAMDVCCTSARILRNIYKKYC